MSTLENWVTIMHAGMDATRPGVPPAKNAAPQNALYFVFFIIVGSFVVLNLFVGVVIDTFQRISDETMGGAFMDARQRDWVSANQIMLQLRPHKLKAAPRARVRHTAYLVVESAYFEAAVSVTILANLVTMTLTFYGESAEHSATLASFNLCFSAIFAVEAALKLLAYYPRQCAHAAHAERAPRTLAHPAHPCNRLACLLRRLHTPSVAPTCTCACARVCACACACARACSMPMSMCMVHVHGACPCPRTPTRTGSYAHAQVLCLGVEPLRLSARARLGGRCGHAARRGGQ